jgi:hypothetical protein
MKQGREEESTLQETVETLGGGHGQGLDISERGRDIGNID